MPGALVGVEVGFGVGRGVGFGVGGLVGIGVGRVVGRGVGSGVGGLVGFAVGGVVGCSVDRADGAGERPAGDGDGIAMGGVLELGGDPDGPTVAIGLSLGMGCSLAEALGWTPSDGDEPGLCEGPLLDAVLVGDDDGGTNAVVGPGVIPADPIRPGWATPLSVNAAAIRHRLRIPRATASRARCVVVTAM